MLNFNSGINIIHVIVLRYSFVRIFFSKTVIQALLEGMT